MHVDFVLTNLQMSWMILGLFWLFTIVIAIICNRKPIDNPADVLAGCFVFAGLAIWTLFLIIVGLLLGYFI